MSGKISSLVDNITGRNNEEEPYKIIHLTKTGNKESRYYLFKTKDVKQYLSFLEKFDEANYQIVDISTSMNVGVYGTQEFYMITYKKKS